MTNTQTDSWRRLSETFRLATIKLENNNLIVASLDLSLVEEGKSY